MFGRRSRKSRAIIDLIIDFEAAAKPQIVSMEAVDFAAGEAPMTAVDAESDAKFFEMIALLDTSLADLLSTCDRIEREVAAAYLPW